MILFLKTWFRCFILLGIAFIPFTFHLFPFQIDISNFLFGGIIDFIALNFLGLDHINDISSDSKSMYILVFILILIASIIGLVLSRSNKIKSYYSAVSPYFDLVFVYYIALQLFNYGFDKIFKGQFYLPEPNILYTPLGHLDKDILFWSTMGSSYSYNLFMGCIQILAAILLLMSKTRLSGLLLSAGIFLNIVAINFSFDISVKVYSLFLLVISLYSLQTSFKKMYRFFIKHELVSLKNPISKPLFNPRGILKPFLKTTCILLMLFEGLIPFLQSGEFNDDIASRPYLHGAYSVVEGNLGASIVDLSETSIEKLFIHRNGYLIIQSADDKMYDFKLDVDQVKKNLILTDYEFNQTVLQYEHSSKSGDLILAKKNQFIRTKSLDWESMPLMQNQFHWTVD